MSAQHGKASDLPLMSDVAADLRDGATLDGLAADYQVSTHQLAFRLNSAGWGTDGLPSMRRGDDLPAPKFMRRDTSWQDRALCREIDLDMFFPELGKSARAAREVCRRCEVREACLEYALANDETWGIWGDTSPQERAKMRRAAKRGSAA